MGEDDVNIVMLETLERALQALDNVLLAQSPGVGLLASCSKVDLLLSARTPLTSNGTSLPL
jgi:hypothetical protein